MEERLYLILDSQGTPLANAVLESPPKARGGGFFRKARFPEK